MADYFTTSQLQLSRNYLDGDFNDVVFNSKHDPLTGLDTGSGNDRWAEPTGTDIKGSDPIVHHVGSTSGPGGTSFFTENVNGTIGYEMEAGTDLRSDNRFVIEPVNLFQGLDAGGMNYAEPVGLDSSTVDVMNNVISNLQPANEFI